MWRSIETVYSVIHTKLDVACFIRHMVVVRTGGVAVRLRSSLKRMLLKSCPNSKMDMQPTSMVRAM